MNNDATDHRIRQRRRVLKTGRISFAESIITCTIKNLSATGAALEVTKSTGVPENFDLVIEMERAIRSCEVVWRREKCLGVRFTTKT
jgi:hypothetical protein